MMDFESLSLENNLPTDKLTTEPEFTSSFINFCEKMGSVFEIRDFLLTLKAQIPKKFKTGELALFYKSKQLGLRRAYVKNSIFYEEEVKQTWSPVNQIRFSSSEETAYLAQEFGRPFFKALIIPLSNEELQNTALLFLEINHNGKVIETLSSFFKDRSTILNLIFKRISLNTHFARISYLWSQLFAYWQEPLAIIQETKTLRCNSDFKNLLSVHPHFLHQKKLSGLIEIGQKIYQTHYYPISDFKNTKAMGILYCQDMTKAFHLREQLFQSKKMSSLSKLGKNMAHQLNNPLTGIQSMTQILCQDPELKELKEELEEIEKATKRSQKIIENLLSFSQVQKGEGYCYLNQIVEGVLPLLKSLTKELKIELNLDSSALKVPGDLSLLQQVAYNLILNSCQALKEDKNNANPCIQIVTKKIGEDQACLKIKDNGHGIPKHNLEKIFQALWTSKKAGEGTGLGLKISQQIIQNLGGQILVSSEEGQFACFSVILPLQVKN